MKKKIKSLAIIGISGGYAIASAPASADSTTGIGLVAGTGQGFSAPTLALVIPSSTSAALYDLSTSLQSLPSWGGSAFNGSALSCALNSTGSIGLVAGFGFSTTALALVIPSSTSATLYDLSSSLSSLPSWTAGDIEACILNSTGSIGLVSGTGNLDSALLALVIPSSTSATFYDLSTSLNSLPGWGGDSSALSCALNSTGNIGLAGGFGQGSPAPALALIIPSSTSAALYDLSTSLKNLPGWGSIGVVSGCALNSTGSIGLVAGIKDPFGPAALALVIPSSTSATLYDLSTSLTSLPGWGGGDSRALGCALNSTGSIGLVAGTGQNGSSAALALVIPSSTSATLYDLSLSLKNLPGWGSIGVVSGCALNSTGSIGLVAGAGQNGSSAALALVIPSSTSATLYDLSTSLTSLPGWRGDSSALGCALSSLTPITIGTYASSVLYAVMTESSALQAHLSYERMRIQRLDHRASLETPYLAEAEPPMQVEAQTDDFSSIELHEPALNTEAPYDIWLMPFGDLLHQAKEGSIPSFTNQVAGSLLGFDAQCGREGVIGGALGYAFDYVHSGEGTGHAKINQETAVVYGSWNGNIGYVNGALWGGIYQVTNERHALFVTSIGKIDGYLLSPHIEGGAVIRTPKDFFYIEPFGMIDWANSWQKSYSETSPFLNLDVPSRYTSLLRSEVGLRFYEKIMTKTLQILLVEKASYINQTPFHMGDETVTFVGSDIPFPIAIGSTRTQNLAGAELHCWFVPLQAKSFYGSIDAQAEVGSSFQSYLASFTIGRRF
jgi:outer membrane autotransporter protein